MEQTMLAGYHAGVKYELQTIPVWDAYEHDADCPLCHMEEKLEADYQRFFLGSSVMAPEMRVEVNRIGFCAEHFRLLDRGSNRLGLALMTQTYLQERQRRIEAARRPLQRGASRGPGRLSRGVLRSFTEALQAEEAGCMICDRLAADIANYAFTIVSLTQSDEEFAETFRRSRGLCLPHMRVTVEVAGDVLRGKQLAAFLRELFSVQDADVGDLDRGLETMAERYDYRSTEPVTEEIKAALPRAIAKLVGRFR